jgi:UDP-N-acetylglucosamine acyltransferase
MKTVVGDANLFMACSHVGHDSILGSHNIFANSSALSGHVTIGDWTTLGGLSGVHQFVRVGDHAFLGAGTMLAKDVPPFCLAQGDRAHLFGLNVVGLKRRGFSSADITTLRRLYKELFLGGGKMAERIERGLALVPDFEAGKKLIEFIQSSERGVVFPRTKGDSGEEE